MESGIMREMFLYAEEKHFNIPGCFFFISNFAPEMNDQSVCTSNLNSAQNYQSSYKNYFIMSIESIRQSLNSPT